MITKRQFFERLKDSAESEDLLAYLIDEGLIGYEDIVSAFSKELWESYEDLSIFVGFDTNLGEDDFE